MSLSCQCSPAINLETYSYGACARWRPRSWPPAGEAGGREAGKKAIGVGWARRSWAGPQEELGCRLIGSPVGCRPEGPWAPAATAAMAEVSRVGRVGRGRAACGLKCRSRGRDVRGPEADPRVVAATVNPRVAATAAAATAAEVGRMGRAGLQHRFRGPGVRRGPEADLRMAAATAAAEVGRMGRAGLQHRTQATGVRRDPGADLWMAAAAEVSRIGRTDPWTAAPRAVMAAAAVEAGPEHLQRLRRFQRWRCPPGPRRRRPSTCGLDGVGLDCFRQPRPSGFWPPGPGLWRPCLPGLWPPGFWPVERGLEGVGPGRLEDPEHLWWPSAPGFRCLRPAARGLVGDGPEHCWSGSWPPGLWPPDSRPVYSFGREVMEASCGWTGRYQLPGRWRSGPPLPALRTLRTPVPASGGFRRSWPRPAWKRSSLRQPWPRPGWERPPATVAALAPYNMVGPYSGRLPERMNSGGWSPVNPPYVKGFKGFLVRG